MRSLKLILFIIICLVFIKPISAQQAPMYSQYMFNEYLINPAFAGTSNYFQIRGVFRNQWTKIAGPQTMSIAGYGPFKERPMGYGGYIYNDVTGPENRFSIGGTYSYAMQINDAWRISGGISMGLFQYTLDGSQITSDPNVYDPVMTGAKESKSMFDATVGLYAWTSYYFVGLSAHQLLGNKYSFYEETDSIQGISRLTQHVYLSGGAIFNLNKEFQLSPSVLIKYTSPAIAQAEINAKVTYLGMAWLGLSYRTIQTMSIMAGYNYENKISLGLAYDFSFGGVQKQFGSTFEILLVYRFVNIK